MMLSMYIPLIYVNGLCSLVGSPLGITFVQRAKLAKLFKSLLMLFLIPGYCTLQATYANTSKRKLPSAQLHLFSTQCDCFVYLTNGSSRKRNIVELFKQLSPIWPQFIDHLTLMLIIPKAFRLTKLTSSCFMGITSAPCLLLAKISTYSLGKKASSLFC